MYREIIGLISFVFIFGGVLIGVFVARYLPEHYLSEETVKAVSVAMAILGTLSALVLGLMTSTASRSFSERSNAALAMSSDLIQVNRLLWRYGPDANDARDKLRTWAVAKSQELFPVAGQPPETGETTLTLLEQMTDAILALAPKDQRQEYLRSRALTLSSGLFETRWLLEQPTEATIPYPFLILLIFWLTIVFTSFGLFAPLNAIAIAALLLCSMAVSGAITMILELDSPFSGVVHLSPQPLRDALVELYR